MRHFEYIDPRIKSESGREMEHERSLGVMVILESLLGIFQVFGVGHIYGGNWKMGVSLMASYWFAAMANAILVPFAIGIFSWPLTWVIFLAVSVYQAIAYAQSTPERFS